MVLGSQIMRSIICESSHRTGLPWWTNMHCMQLRSLPCRRLPSESLRKIWDLTLNILQHSWMDYIASSSLNFHYQPRCSVILIFWTWSFISGTRRKSCSVRLAWGCWGCICCDIMGDVRYFCHTRKESGETSFYFYKRKCSCLVNKVVHFISRLSTCFHHSVIRIILNYCCDCAMIITQSFA